MLSLKISYVARSQRSIFVHHSISRLFSSKSDRGESDWVTINLGSKGDIEASNMEDRLHDAKRWVSRKLDADEASLLNRKLGIEKDILEYENKIKNSKRAAKSPSLLEDYSSSRIRGFLELNPYLCSGCGSPFQSKDVNAPGYLPKEKFSIHRVKAEMIRERQDALKILDMAGIEIDSPVAEEVLRSAKVSTEVLDGLRSLSESGAEDIPKRDSNSISEAAKNAEEDTAKEQSNHISDDKVLKYSSHGIDSTNVDDKTFDDKFAVAEVEPSVKPEVSRLIKSNKSSARKKSTFLKRINEIQSIKSIPIYDGDDIPHDVTGTEESAAPPLTLKQSVDNDAGEGELCICQRCFRLQQYGQVEQILRPGWSSHELLTPERFQYLLGAIKQTEAVVLCIVDIFDLQGSLLPNLKAIAGPNPIFIAANKVDLLPKGASPIRLQGWVHDAVKSYCDLRSPRDAHEMARQSFRDRGWIRAREEEAGVLRRSNVHLVSCASGLGVDKLMDALLGSAKENGNKVYVMGAANVGKSSFINRLLEGSNGGSSMSAKNRKKSNVPQATVSNLPGTTLDFIKIRLPNGVTMIDTPGLINKGQLTSRVTTNELKLLIPNKPVKAVTLRVMEGKCVLIGAIARIELTKVGLYGVFAVNRLIIFFLDIFFREELFSLLFLYPMKLSCTPQMLRRQIL